MDTEDATLIPGPGGAPSPAVSLVFAALFFSGTAGIVNQVVWQRALKLFLGGSDALSSLTVVLVFMAGLGAGSLAVAARASRLSNPLRALVSVEAALAVVNLGVAAILALDLDDSVFAAQRFAISLGVPLRLLYVLGAMLLLFPPCFLMGVTLPVSSEGCQRQLGAGENRLIAVLFGVNTLGAVVGAVGSAFVLLPWLGQRMALVIAAAGNLTAAVLALRAATRSGPAPPAPAAGAEPRRRRRVTVEDWAGLALGFLALGYEMLVFRLMVLAHEPLPQSFATVLCFYLLWWTLGVYAAADWRERVNTALMLTVVLVALAPAFHELDRFNLRLPLVSAGAIYCAPAVGFGLAYGALASRSARAWGRDVGRFSAFNTAGSCLGVAFFVLVGYEAPPWLVAYAIAVGVAGVLGGLVAVSVGRHRRAAVAAAVALAAMAFAGVLTRGLARELWVTDHGFRAYYDPDGVIEIDRAGGVIWDGLWHSRLARGDGHIGSDNWLLGAAPVLVHRGPVEEALVIGLGTGITAATVARSGSVRTVSVYELNPGLASLLRDDPEGTLHVGANPRINLIWGDGRTGLALSEKRYDLVTQQPTYLRQAGSSRLLSREYFELVRSRLKPGGVFCIYASTPTVPSQARAVRDTAATVFTHSVTFRQGYLLVASDSPLMTTREAFEARASLGDPLASELRLVERGLRLVSPGATLFDLLDSPTLPATPGGLVITDDHPIVEYPEVTSYLLRARDTGPAAALDRAGARHSYTPRPTR